MSIDDAIASGAQALRASFEDPEDAQIFADLAVTAARPVQRAGIRKSLTSCQTIG